MRSHQELCILTSSTCGVRQRHADITSLERPDRLAAKPMRWRRPTRTVLRDNSIPLGHALPSLLFNNNELAPRLYRKNQSRDDEPCCIVQRHRRALDSPSWVGPRIMLHVAESTTRHNRFNSDSCCHCTAAIVQWLSRFWSVLVNDRAPEPDRPTFAALRAERSSARRECGNMTARSSTGDNCKYSRSTGPLLGLGFRDLERQDSCRTANRLNSDESVAQTLPPNSSCVPSRQYPVTACSSKRTLLNKPFMVHQVLWHRMNLALSKLYAP